jgi:hypothetical protein
MKNTLKQIILNSTFVATAFFAGCNNDYQGHYVPLHPEFKQEEAIQGQVTPEFTKAILRIIIKAPESLLPLPPDPNTPSYKN